MRVRAEEHALHADHADEHPRLATRASVRALLTSKGVDHKSFWVID